MKLKGKSLMLRVNGATIALATSCSLNTTTQTTESRTKDDATGPAAEFDFVDWTASSENMLGANKEVTGQMLYSSLMDLQLAGTVVEISMDLMSATTGKIPAGDWTPDTASADTGFASYGGKAIIESVSMTAPNEGNATVSVNFKAVGPLAKIPA